MAPASPPNTAEAQEDLAFGGVTVYRASGRKSAAWGHATGTALMAFLDRASACEFVPFQTAVCETISQFDKGIRALVIIDGTMPKAALLY
jgi:hypothetical protein